MNRFTLAIVATAPALLAAIIGVIRRALGGALELDAARVAGVDYPRRGKRIRPKGFPSSE